MGKVGKMGKTIGGLCAEFLLESEDVYAWPKSAHRPVGESEDEERRGEVKSIWDVLHKLGNGNSGCISPFTSCYLRFL